MTAYVHRSNGALLLQFRSAYSSPVLAQTLVYFLHIAQIVGLGLAALYDCIASRAV